MMKLLASFVMLVAMMPLSLVARAQAPAAPKFDPRDLSGYWLRNTVRPRIVLR